MVRAQVRSACLAAAIVSIFGCGGSPLTSARIESVVGTTFANLVRVQVSSLGLPPIRPEDVGVRATCRRPTGTAERGSGEWTCTVAWQGPDARPVRDTYDVFVATDGCYIAGAEAATLGGPTITTSEGRAVKNLLYKFEGCFDPI
jgi:hypothetical protein